MTKTDISTFHSLYTKYYRRSFLFVQSYVHNEFVAEDIVSESLIKLWDYINEKQPIEFLPLYITILKNKALDHLKHERVKMETHKTLSHIYERDLDIRISTLNACNPDDIYSKEIIELIKKTLESLPPQTRKVFEMSREENKSGKEIAQELNITVKGVEYHMGKAIRAFRTNLKDYLPLLYFII